MSLESGRKLGLTASIISIVFPTIIMVSYMGFFFSVFSSVSSTIRGGVSPNIILLPTIMGVIIGAWIIGIIGYILFLIAMNNLSKYYSEPAIFKNLLNALIIAIVGSIILGAVLVLSGVFLQTASYSTAPVIFSFVSLGVFIVGIVAIVIYCAYLTKRAFDKLAEKSAVDSFRTAGLLILIGSIVPLVAYVGWVFAAIGYNRLTPNKPATNYVPQYAMPPVGPTKRCPSCGTENIPSAVYCMACGKKLPTS